MQWGHFVCPSSSQKRESTAFNLILRSACVLVSKLVEVVLHVGKLTVAKIYAIESPVLDMGRILKNKLSPLRVNIVGTIFDEYCYFFIHCGYTI